MLFSHGFRGTMQLWAIREIFDPLLLRIGPSETALLDWLTPHIDDSLLGEIAAADYGSEEKEHFEALKSIRDQRRIPIPLRWVPREVLELMRWSEPEDPSWKPGSAGTRGHLIRAYCCTLLLKASGAPEMKLYTSSENDTLIQMIASVLYLGREATEAASRFLCWCLSRLAASDKEYPFFVLGLLLLRAALFMPGENGIDLEVLAEWTIQEERQVRQEQSNLVESDKWLLGLINFAQKHEAWVRVSEEVLSDPSKEFPEPAASAMREIVNRILPQNA